MNGKAQFRERLLLSLFEDLEQDIFNEELEGKSESFIDKYIEPIRKKSRKDGNAAEDLFDELINTAAIRGFMYGFDSAIALTDTEVPRSSEAEKEGGDNE